MKKRLISVLLTVAVLGTFVTIAPVIPTVPVQAAASINIGDYVQMGRYYNEPILWRCVDIDANGPLMLADKILTIKSFDAQGTHKYLDGTTQADSKGYRAIYGSDLWQTSSIRAWLNSTASAGSVKWLDGCKPTQDKVSEGNNDYAIEKGFLAVGNFSAGDRSTMKYVNQKSLLNPMDTSKLSVGGNAGHTYSYDISTIVQNYDTAYYHNVTDKMFLLDVKQVNRVYQNGSTLSTNYYIGKPTQKAVDNSEYKYSELSVNKDWYYFLRTPSADSNVGYSVRRVGNGGANTSYASVSHVGVRPAFYLDLQSAIIKYGTGIINNPYKITTITPEIANVTDKSTSINGTAIAKGIVKLTVGKTTYSINVPTTGKWIKSLAKTLSIGTKITCKVIFNEKTSTARIVYVKPTPPSVNKITSTSKMISGKTYTKAKVLLKISGKWSSITANSKGAFSFKLAKMLKKGSSVVVKATYKMQTSLEKTLKVA